MDPSLLAKKNEWQLQEEKQVSGITNPHGFLAWKASRIWDYLGSIRQHTSCLLYHFIVLLRKREGRDSWE
jgi:hypothetical protein